ncbi:MAG TPA: Ku protein [Pyrinomonadaceae bacterium]|nr:Ku protein [Pyrinomonadaceae bacterium]
MPPRGSRASSKRAEPEEENAGGRPFWSGTLTFGLVSVPVSLFPATRTVRTSLRMLGPDGQPLARKYYAEKTGKDLDADEVVRGFEVTKEKFVIVTDEELERLAPEKTRDIDLKQFVPAESIPPIYFERGYFLTPAAGSQKAYKLLAETMDKSGLAGIATFVMRGKEYLVAIFSDKGILRAETMRFADELRSAADVGLPKKKEVAKASVTKFEKLIANKSKKQFTPAKLADKQTDSLLKLVKKKQSKRENVVKVEEETDTDHKVVDLVKILKQSLGGKK